MRLPKNLLQDNYVRPNLFLCNTNKEKICQLDPIDLSGVFKFNSFSELNFSIGRYYVSLNSGARNINPYYDMIEGLYLVYLEGFGYFEIQSPKISSNGIKEFKDITAYSTEYMLSQKIIENFKINTGETDSLEVIYAENENNIIPISLYNKENHKLSLLHLLLENVYGWTIGHVDFELETLTRSFEIEQTSVYDFLMNDVCDAFHCHIVFDTINNTINLYAEEKEIKFFGDGINTDFVLDPIFFNIGSVSIDGYLTDEFTYDNKTGIVSFFTAPNQGAKIEIRDGAMNQYLTDVYISFENLSKEINIEYDIDSIKTVLNVTYGDNIDIREANLGTNKLVDLSYYHTPEWMGLDLYNAYNAYLIKSKNFNEPYRKNTEQMLEYLSKIDFEENRLSLGYSVADVDEKTVGTYYTRGGTAPNYYYVAVSLPADYIAGTTYYSIKTTNLTEEKVSSLYTCLKKCYHNDDDWVSEMNKLSESFAFMETYTIEQLVNNLKTANTFEQKDVYVIKFLNIMWNEIGLNPLTSLYERSYKDIQVVNIENKWAEKSNDNYGYYYPVVIMLNTIHLAQEKRKVNINSYQKLYNDLQNLNKNIVDELVLDKNFNTEQLLKLNTFLREDYINFDNIVETENDSVNETFINKKHAIENGRIELHKISQPRLQFSMSMKNIYAIRSFEKIIDQFQLGNVVRIALRKDYVKQSRLLQVNFNFNDFSDFSCEFGELTNLQTQSDIHADLLAQAITTSKTVASQSKKWTEGSNQSSEIQEKINKGLLDSATVIKSIDATQGVVIDKYGIHLNKIVDVETGEIDKKQGWITNNMFVYSDDGFKSSKSVFGDFTYDGQNYYGVLAEAVVGGYVVGSIIEGGEIKIGKKPDGTYNFVVDKDGNVTMDQSKIEGYVTQKDFDDFSTEVANKNVYFQNQLDGKVNFYFGLDIPTLNNYPAKDWTEEDKKNNLGDLYYVKQDNAVDEYTGNVYRWEMIGSVYVWVQVKDVGLETVLRNAAQAQDTADNKRRVFTVDPYAPYDVGDLWSVGEQGSLKVCKIAKQKKGTEDLVKDWQNASNINKELNNFKTEVSKQNQDFQEQIDGKINTYYYPHIPTLLNKPTSEWKESDYSKHSGDLFYITGKNPDLNNDNGKAYRWVDANGKYQWLEIEDASIKAALENAAKAQDTADHKRRVFTSQPTTEQEYDEGDLWAPGDQGSLKVCVKHKDIGVPYNASDWKDASSIDEDLKAFENLTNQNFENINMQFDGKIDTYFGAYIPTSNNIPAKDWTDNDVKRAHIDDLFYVTGIINDKNYDNGKIYRWVNSSNTYKWTEISDAQLQEALSAASKAQDTADGKKRVFLTQPTTDQEYDEGDLWAPGNNGSLKVCIKHKNAGEPFNANHWIEASNIDKTMREFEKTVQNIQIQVDGKINTYYYPYKPSNSKLPTSQWKKEDYEKHVDDLFYITGISPDVNNDNGKIYRWKKSNNDYSWAQIEDSELKKALSDASNAQDTADHKRRVFVENPTLPYDVGDLWSHPYNSSSDTKTSLKVCVNSKKIGETIDLVNDWKDSSSINKDLSNFETATNNNFDKIKNQVDGKISTYYYSYIPNANNIPASQWKDEETKKAHVDDLFYVTGIVNDTGNNNGKIYRWVGPPYTTYQWIQIEDSELKKALSDASQAQDTADHKRRVFVITPYPPYDVGDLWAPGKDGKLKVAKTAKKKNESYDQADWKDASSIDEDLKQFKETTIDNNKYFQKQIDGKIITYFNTSTPTVSNYPASGWTSETLKKEHLGDLCYVGATGNYSGKAYRWEYVNSTFMWVEVKDEALTSALKAASKAQDTADKKRRVFINTPYTPYDQGDLWSQGDSGELMRCNKSRSSGSYVPSDWGVATNTNKKFASFEKTIDGITSTVSKVETTANNASSTATQAKNTANEASKTATGAKDAADEATRTSNAATTKVSELEQTVNGFSTTVTETVELANNAKDIANTASGVATSANTTATEAKQLASEVKQTSQEIELSVRNLQVGNGNLLLGSEKMLGRYYWHYSNSNNGVPEGKYQYLDDGSIIITNVNSNAYYLMKITDIIPGRTYTFSVLFKYISGEQTMLFDAAGFNSADDLVEYFTLYHINANNPINKKQVPQIDMGNGWKQVFFSIKATNPTVVSVGCYVRSGSYNGQYTNKYQFMHPMFIEGTNPANWAPSYLDTESKFTVKADEISATVNTKANAEGGNKASFAWQLKESGFFIVANNKNLISATKDGLSIEGKITAFSGKIGGWTIDNTSINVEEPDKNKSIEISSLNGLYGGINGKKWYIKPSGDAYFENAKVIGHIEANTGKIGGWEITPDNWLMGKTQGSDLYTIIAPPGTAGGADGRVFLAGGGPSNKYSYPFEVYQDGRLRAKDAYIEGEIQASGGKLGRWVLDSSSINYVSKGENKNFVMSVFGGLYGGISGKEWHIRMNGDAYFESATVKGHIEAGSGKIGGWNIDGQILGNAFVSEVADGNRVGIAPGIEPTTGEYKPKNGLCFWAGASWEPGGVAYGKAPFRVYADGSLYASKGKFGGELTAATGSFNGTVTAKSGEIGPWTINADKITSGLYAELRQNGVYSIGTDTFATWNTMIAAANKVANAAADSNASVVVKNAVGKNIRLLFKYGMYTGFEIA